MSLRDITNLFHKICEHENIASEKISGSFDRKKEKRKWTTDG